MSDTNTVQELNEELARKIHDEARRNPHSPYANKYVGIANGQVVAATDDLDELMLHLRQIAPDPEKCYCVWIEPNGGFNEANEIWGLR